MASDARAKANPEGPRTWVAIALFLLFLIYGVDKYFYDIPNFLDDEFEENHTTQLKPRSKTLPAATPHFDALQKRLAEEKALSRTWTPQQKKEDKKWASQLQPLWGLEHNPRADVVMSLGFGYNVREFARFVATLRKTGYPGDIVLATGPEERMQKGVPEYLRGEKVLAYPFTYAKKKEQGRRLLMTPAGTQLTNWYAGGDKRGPRPLAISRYEMYRTWLSYYEPSSWGIVFDFRDTFFQRDPFQLVDRSKKAPNLLLFAENRQVKRVGNCVFNSGWMRCFLGKQELKKYANHSVVCSGSTMGSVPALRKYTERMISQMDKSKCHATPARTESDQGYHNYLYDTGELAKLKGVRVTHYEQGYGIVNTIGAMNGFRVPAHLKGPLDTHWKIRDSDGYLLDYNGERSAVVHQWDRFYKEVVRFVDKLADDHRRAQKL